MLNIARTFANDGWLYVGMQNTDIGLASLVNCPVCPVTVGENVKCGPAQLRPVEPGWAVPHFRPIGLGFSGPGRVLG